MIEPREVELWPYGYTARCSARERRQRALVRNPHQGRAGRARARNAPSDKFGRFLSIPAR
jgi:hypothetical protein